MRLRGAAAGALFDPGGPKVPPPKRPIHHHFAPGPCSLLEMIVNLAISAYLAKMLLICF
jgi:hypothetical protein